MIRVVFLSFLFLSNLYAEKICTLDENTSYKDCKQSIQVFIDDNTSYSLSNPPSKDLFSPTQNTSLGYQFQSVWTKFSLKNESNRSKEFLLVNPRAGMDEIAVLIYQNDRLVREERLGDMYPIEEKSFYHRYSAIKIELGASEDMVVVSKVKNNISMEVTWIAVSKDVFEKLSNYDLLAWGFYYGLFFALIIYSINSYFILKNRVFIMYALLGISFAMQISSYNGILYMFSSAVVFNNLLIWIFFPLTMTFMLLLAKDFFMTPQTMPTVDKYISLGIIVIVTFGVVLSIGYLFFKDAYILFTLKKISVFTTLLVLLPLIIGTIAIRQKLKGAVFYTVGQGLYAAAILYFVMANRFADTFSFTSIYAPLVGSTVDMIFLSVALGQYFRHLKYSNEQNEKLLIAQSAFSNIGKSIGHITHQWRHPIAQLGGSVVLLESIFIHKKEEFYLTFEQQLPAVKKYLKSLEHTLDDFSSFYSSPHADKEYNPLECINNTTHLLRSKIILKNVSLSVNIPKEMTFYGQENIFSNILLILIDNSLDAFPSNHDNTISITIVENNDWIEFLYQDNAGGITIHPIEKVFDYFTTTKEGDTPHGFGLPIAKLLIEEKLHGTISIRNTEDGVLFSIHIKSNDIQSNPHQ